MRIARYLLLALLLAMPAQAGLVNLSGARCFDCGQAPGGGEVSHGDTVEITGSGFGTGPTTSFLQPQIEATANGVVISLPSDGWVEFSDPDVTDDYSGYVDFTRGPAIRATSPGGGGINNHAIVWDRGSNAAANELLYFTWWVRWQTLGPDFPDEVDDDEGCTDINDNVAWQWKLARWRNNNDVQDDFADGDSYAAHWVNSGGSFFEVIDFHYINCTAEAPFVNGASGRRAGGNDLPDPYTQVWSRVEWFINMGTAGTADSRMYVRHEGGSRNLVGLVLDSTWTGAYRFLVLQNYGGNLDGDIGSPDFAGSEVALDDPYAQRGNLRRVELTNHATLGSETWREIQDASSWSDTSIEVTLNTGAGRTGQAWLKVIETNITTGADTELGSLEITISALFEGFAANDDLLAMAA